MIKILNWDKFIESVKGSDMWNILPASIKELHTLFKNNGYQLFVVGGSVRDFLLGEKPKDFDLATDASPDDILSILKGYRTNLQGKAFGVIVVFTKDQPMGMEIATFREDSYNELLGKTRNPNVKFSTIEKDVLRRDIPFNAMFYDLEKREIVDLVGGINDIENKIVRFVGEPELRIKEDPLRILRLIRFACRYQFNIEDKTSKAISENMDTLRIISQERIWEEFNKSFSQAKDFNDYIEYLNYYNLFDYVFPGMKINTSKIDSDNIAIIIASLFKGNKPNTREWIAKYNMNRDVSVKVLYLLEILTVVEDLNPDSLEYIHKLKIRSHIDNTEIMEWIKLNRPTSPILKKIIEYTPTVDAVELMEMGYKGAELGQIVRKKNYENFIK